ncbi:hypothetical protein SELMODRAFT_413662 [Selaginella moellendorffii]|uniref:Cytidyltransferase-like domain-containing protein n=1 Tax=Selaginella moellendorffii TaxID=88036 RepID=D8RPT5_SELML|nr:hypothetical protein SELMODRAFT_413662 [Selaginella moellendorffii]
MRRLRSASSNGGSSRRVAAIADVDVVRLHIQVHKAVPTESPRPSPPLSPRSGISLPASSVWRIHKEPQVKPILLALSFNHGVHSKCSSCSAHVIFFKTKCQVLRENRFWILILKILKKTILRPLPFAKGFVKSLKNGEDYRKEAFGSNWYPCLMNGLICRESQALWCIDDWESQVRRSQGYRDCFGEDCLSSQLLIKAMVDVCEIGNTVPGELKSPKEEIRDSRLNYTEDEELEQLIHGNVCMVDYPGEGSKDYRTGRRVVLSGDFNPLHEGHLTLMSTACT